MRSIISAKRIQPLCEEFGVSYLGVFGSYARQEETDKSDLDVLIEFESSQSFFEMARFQRALESIVGVSVDLVPRSTLKKQLKPFIMGDIQTIYGKDRASVS